MALSNRSHSFTPAQASHVLNQLLESGAVTARDLQIAQLEQQLNALRGGAGPRRPGRPPAAAAVSAGGAAAAPVKRRQRNLSPERRAALVRQGHYLALVRQVPKTRRKQYAVIFKTKGGAAAIAALRKVLGK